MGTYEELKAAIQQVITTNGNNEITGALLQQTLLSIVNTVGNNATFAGIATPTTNPGTPDQNVFYLATEAGTYVNFNNIEISAGEAVILTNKTGAWVKNTSGFVTQQQLTELSEETNNVNLLLTGKREEQYTINGYNNIVGKYSFKKGVQYTFYIESSYSGTTYFAIIAEGKYPIGTIAITQFPHTLTYVADDDYDGATLEIGNAGIGEYNISVTANRDIQREVEKIEYLEDFLIHDEDFNGTYISKNIAVEPNSVYLVEITKGVTSGFIYLKGSVGDMYIIQGFNEGKYYIPTFHDEVALSIRLYGSFSENTTIALKIYKVVKSPSAPIPYIPLYIPSVGNDLTFTWYSGYWTNPQHLNPINYWVNSNIQYNKGKRITITYPSEKYAVIVRSLAANTKSAVDVREISSGETINTANFGPWIIGVRFKDYGIISPSIVGEEIEITYDDSEVFSMPMSMLDMPKIENDTPIGLTLIDWKLMHHQGVESSYPVVPSQSLYDIGYAKSLGFKTIEANVHVCSDGVAVVKHGVNDKLGEGLGFVDGSNLTSETLFSEVTSQQLRNEVYYTSRLVKYQGGHIPTLEEFLSECARLDMIPFIRGCTTEMLSLARTYLPDNKLIIEGLENRGDFKGLMTIYGSGGGGAYDILATCERYGAPFYYCWSQAANVSESLFEDVANTLHSHGYLLGTAYISEQDSQRLLSKGLDIVVSTSLSIPPFEVGNAININRLNDSRLDIGNAVYEPTDDIIELPTNDRVLIKDYEYSALGKINLRIRYSGNLTIIFGQSQVNGRDIISHESNGEQDFEYAVSLVFESIPLQIIANSDSVIYNMHIALSTL